MDKITFVKESLAKLGIPELTGNKFSKYRKSILDLAVYGRNIPGMTASAATSIGKNYFPDKPKTISIFAYLCDLENVKYCNSCESVLPRENFSNDKSTRDGKTYRCKFCVYDKVGKHTTTFYSAKYRAAKLQRTIFEDESDSIKEFYSNCPEGYEVDHIIPLQGVNVSGLHVLNNLQYLTKEENLQKSNFFEPNNS